MKGPPSRFRWTKREGWGDGYYDGHLARWKVAQITPTGGIGGMHTSACEWNLPIVCHWREDFPGPYSGEAGTPRDAARAAEAAFPAIVTTHPLFAMRIEDEELFRAMLGLPMSDVGLKLLGKRHRR